MITGLCKYKDINGKPGEAHHKWRIGPFAAFDIVVTVLPALICAYIFDWNFIIVFTALIVLGIVIHRIFCVNTALNVMIFGKV